MLAYLGHQVESRQLVRYGLAIAEEAAVQDRLAPRAPPHLARRHPAPTPEAAPEAAPETTPEITGE